MYQVPAVPYSLIKILLNIIIPCAPCSSEGCLSFWFIYQNCLCTSHLSHAFHISRPSQSNTWQRYLFACDMNTFGCTYRYTLLHCSALTLQSESWEADCYLCGVIHPAAGHQPVTTEDQVQSHSGLCGIFWWANGTGAGLSPTIYRSTNVTSWGTGTLGSPEVTGRMNTAQHQRHSYDAAALD